MLFRIEDNANLSGHHRKYRISREELPILRVKKLEKYLANEIRKGVNNAKDRTVLNYSKSLGVCLLKYNEYTDNELHINDLDTCDFVLYSDIESGNCSCESYNLKEGLDNEFVKLKNRKIVLENFKIDISDNDLLDTYLKKVTGKGRKKVASPEKDKEVLLMQSPNDMVISEYLDSVYILYGLFLKYGMKEAIYNKLVNKIRELEDYRFNYSQEVERDALIVIVDYLYYKGKDEMKMSRMIVLDSLKSGHISLHFDPILQVHEILNESFEDAYELGDYYSGSIVSDWIWKIYADSILYGEI